MGNAGKDKIRVYFTIDTETSLGGAWRNPAFKPLPVELTIFGKRGSRNYGIPLIMDILDQHGFRGTFFTEVFCSYVLGEDPVAGVCRYIQDRGHDLQLHLHPIYKFYRDAQAGLPPRQIDLFFQLSPDEQHQLLGEGVELFRRFSGKAPRAFRAGCYGASEATLTALRTLGVEIDSSYNLSYLDRTCGFQTRPLNAPAQMEGVCEFPVTNFRVAGAAGYKPLEISAVSVAEIVSTIRGVRETGCRDVVLMLHSFSLLKNLGVRFENCRPDGIVIQRLRKLCARLDEMRDEVEVGVLGEASATSLPRNQSQAVPSAGWLRPCVRKLVQGVDRLPWI